MLGKLLGAQFELERVLASAAQGFDMSDLASRLGSLADLRQTLTTASPAEMPALRAVIATTVAASLAAVQQTQDGASKLTAASEEQRRSASLTLKRLAYDYFERRVLEPYLRFDSAEEEQAFRQRERERDEAIKRERAKGTTEGERNAVGLMLNQIHDAGAHGADRSPEYAAMLKDAEKAQAQLAPGGNARSQNVEAATTMSDDRDFTDVMAVFRAAGVTTTERGAGHGLGDKDRGNDIGTGRV